MHLLKTEFGEALNADSITRLFVLDARDRRTDGISVDKIVANFGSSVIAELLSGSQVEVALFEIDAASAEAVTVEAAMSASARAQALVDALCETLTASSRGLVDAGYIRSHLIPAKV